MAGVVGELIKGYCLFLSISVFIAPVIKTPLIQVQFTSRFIHREDEELADLKKQRRPGRPSSTKEDLIRRRFADEEQEYSTGFCKSSLW